MSNSEFHKTGMMPKGGFMSPYLFPAKGMDWMKGAGLMKGKEFPVPHYDYAAWGAPHPRKDWSVDEYWAQALRGKEAGKGGILSQMGWD